MTHLAQGLTILVAVLHVLFLYLEMFLWDTPYGRRVFRTTLEQARSSAVLAANQGLYNGFLAAGLLWSFRLEPAFASEARIFFLGCVIVAGLYGAWTTSRRILYVQTLPALLALGAVLASR